MLQPCSSHYGDSKNSCTIYQVTMVIPQNRKIVLPYDPAVPLLEMYPKEMKSTHKRDTCIPVFIAAVFSVPKLWNQPRSSSVNEGIKKIWYM